jgi:MFS superfamily sulfate permease-like transporter
MAAKRMRRWVLPGVETALHYKRAWLLPDLRAGLVVTALLIPAGMGYAEVAGLPPQTGLYATIVPLLAYALFGPSRILVLGPDSALAPIIAAAILPLALGTMRGRWRSPDSSRSWWARSCCSAASCASAS